MNKAASLLGGLALAASATTSAMAQTYEVTVTNLTYGQVITPPLIVAHSKKVQVFEVGEQASEELKILAESGNPQPLAEAMEATAGVFSVATHDGVIPPGQSATIKIHGNWKNRFSVLGMLATTNDAFIAAQGINPGWRNQFSVDAAVYDAGTEENNELCDFIPGPPCGGASNLTAQENAEGFIHVHRGFHGINVLEGDVGNSTGEGLDGAVLDWRGDAARITIKRVRY